VNDYMNNFLDPYSSMLDMGNLLAKGAENISKLDYEQVKVGTTPKSEVFKLDKVTLYHYHSLPGEPPKTKPVLITYGLIGRYTMIDLQEDRSLVRNLLARGVDLYVVDWGNPSRADQFLTFEDYVCYYLDECVNTICREHGIDAVTLFGICEGGVFTSMYAALYPEKVKNLLLSITPIDFEADQIDTDPSHGFLNLWIRNMDTDDIEKLIEAFGNLPGEMMGGIFQAMTPVRSMTKYNLGFLEAAKDDDKLLNFLRMEKWLADRPSHPGLAAKQWLIDLYKENRLIKGTFELGGEKVDLGKITMPVLNIYAERDHIIPPPCSTALGKHLGSKEYTELALPGGHVGIYVSSKLQGMVGEGISSWLLEKQ
jgi:polyhydroxyalkanoate synthase